MSVKDIAPTFQHDPETRRALELDALAAILPIDRRDRLAELSPTRRRDPEASGPRGMGENTLRALASDLAYLEAWALAATASPALAGRPRRWRSNSWRIISGIRRSARPTTAMACRPTSATLCAPGLLQPKARMRPTPSGGASRAGRPCTVGAGSRARSPPLPSARRFGSPSAPPGVPAGARAERAVTRDILDRLAATAAPTGSSTARPRHPDGRLRVGRPPAQRDRQPAARAAQRGNPRSVRSRRCGVEAPALPLDPARPHQDRPRPTRTPRRS